MKKATIKDVSKISGFSITTVSRVLNGNYPVKKETKEKILSVISELNFSRNEVARNLRTQKSNIVGLVVPDINNPYYSSIAKKLDSGLFKYDYNLIVCNTTESEQKEKKILTALNDKRVDAIVISPVAKNVDILRQLKDSGISIIVIDRNMGVSDLPFIGSDNFEESKKLSKILINNGHHRMIFVSGTPKAITSQERLRGFKSALVENNLSFADQKVIEGNYEREPTYKKMHQLLSENLLIQNPFTAVFSSNNLMTKGIIKAANDLQIKIPDEISLVSFGELDSQEIIQPKITCIKQNIEQITKTVLSDVLSLLRENKEINSTIIPDSLVQGNSIKKIN